MTDKPKREYPLRWVEDATGEPHIQLTVDFTAWMMELTVRQLADAVAIHGKIPPEMAARSERRREAMGGLDVAIEAYMRGEA